MINASHIKVHPHAAGARGGNQDMSRTKGGSTPKYILAYAVLAGMETVIPPKKNRREQRQYDKYLYKLRHLVENCFLALKCWRGIATRYAKTTDAFIAAVHIRCIAIWAAIRA